jgi:hypothetical protein
MVPQKVAGEANVLPGKRRGVGEQLIRDDVTLGAIAACRRVSARPQFAVAGHTLGIGKLIQYLTKDGFWACVYAVTAVSGALVTARSGFGIGIPIFFSRSASASAIFVR